MTDINRVWEEVLDAAEDQWFAKPTPAEFPHLARALRELEGLREREELRRFAAWTTSSASNTSSTIERQRKEPTDG